MTLRITLCQFRIQAGNVQANIRSAETCIQKAAERGSQIALLPELWSTGYDLTNARLLAQSLNQGYFASLSNLSSQYQIYTAGSALESFQDKAYNTFTLYAPDGNLAGVYRKVHLFHLMNEDSWLTPGDCLTLVDTPFGKVGLSVCYDLRFPEMFRQYALQGARLVLISAEWPAERLEHWRLLLRTRAVENQYAVAATNSCGLTESETYGGYSTLVNAWGEISTEAGEAEQVATGDVDLDLTEQIRKKINVLGDRRPDIYG